MTTWTALASPDFSVGEIPTATKINTHITDNLRYLHGDEGPVTLIDTLKLPVTAGSSGKGLRYTDGATDYANVQGLDLSGTSFIFFSTNREFDGTAWQQFNTRVGGNLQISGDELLFSNFPVSSSTSAERFRIKSDGKVGIGTGAPKGQLHVASGTGNMLFFQQGSIVGTPISILAAGAVTKFLTAFGVAENGAGNQAGFGSASPTGQVGCALNANIALTVGTSTIAIIVNANGSVDVQRTGGAQTLSLAVLLVWI